MDELFYARVRETLDRIEADGLLKPFRVLTSAQGAQVQVADSEGGSSRSLINLCANNYLGLANSPEVVEAATQALGEAGSGFASVGFICGTHEIHKALEREIAAYLHRDDAILFAAAFDANGALFEPLLDDQDAIVSDSLNHASIIDGIRLCKARRYRYRTGDMNDLEAQLRAARSGGARTILIATDGVFSMDGYLADLRGITGLARRFNALVMVDDCHATGLLGPEGRGVPALQGVEDGIDILTGTFGKALGGAMGGYIAARTEIISLLRQRARPYLFSNAPAPSVCGSARAAIRIAAGAGGDQLRERLAANARHFRLALEAAGFELRPGHTPIIPVMLGDARRAQRMAGELFDRGVLVAGFSYPVVPTGEARIRVQLSAAHTPAQLDSAAEAFVGAGRASGVL